MTDSVHGVIFDLDGTLVDSKLNFDQLRKDLGFPEKVPVLEHISGIPDHERRRQCLDIVHRFELEGARLATWIPGARELLQLLNELQIPTGILTRNMREAVELTMDKLEINVDIVLTREDFPPKPDPEALLHIAKNWRLAPSQCVYVGDFLFDIQAARNAGMRSWFYAPENPPTYASDADRVFTHFEELAVEFANSGTRAAL
ncbi:phosphatase [Hahella sp. CCB-MM4]|uniref:HAD family hydrolase n=1 Tax=Hahella sp. (strain CCB-MM4) TaxID=1926491 RepID=UPI000B9AF5F0|nr:HAD family hydrolase [Hahella sp. CCB-MM4]OZG73356.1 phosphatase [Hahella sp. CCB-MM4]